jgi:hypothetical protein
MRWNATMIPLVILSLQHSRNGHSHLTHTKEFQIYRITRRLRRYQNRQVLQNQKNSNQLKFLNNFLQSQLHWQPRRNLQSIARTPLTLLTHRSREHPRFHINLLLPKAQTQSFFPLQRFPQMKRPRNSFDCQSQI